MFLLESIFRLDVVTERDFIRTVKLLLKVLMFLKGLPTFQTGKYWFGCMADV